MAVRSRGEGVWSVRSRRASAWFGSWLESWRLGMARGADLGSVSGFRLVRPGSSPARLADDAAEDSRPGSVRLDGPAGLFADCGLPLSDELASAASSPRRGSAELSAADRPPRPAEISPEAAPRGSSELSAGVGSPRLAAPARPGSPGPSADAGTPRPDEPSPDAALPRRDEPAELSSDLGAPRPGESAERPAEAVPRRSGSAGSFFARLASRRARARAAALRSARLGRREPAGRPGESGASWASGAESPSEGSGVGGVIARDASKDRSRRGDSRAASTRPERTSR